jgi:hypothetical protein
MRTLSLAHSSLIACSSVEMCGLPRLDLFEAQSGQEGRRCAPRGFGD